MVMTIIIFVEPFFGKSIVNYSPSMYLWQDVICCRDGSTKCGLFLCAHGAIELLKTENIIDIYYIVSMAKSRKQEYVPTMVSINIVIVIIVCTFCTDFPVLCFWK